MVHSSQFSWSLPTFHFKLEFYNEKSCINPIFFVQSLHMVICLFVEFFYYNITAKSLSHQSKLIHKVTFVWFYWKMKISWLFFCYIANWRDFFFFFFLIKYLLMLEKIKMLVKSFLSKSVDPVYNWVNVLCWWTT